MSVRELRQFFSDEIESASKDHMLLSLHLKVGRALCAVRDWRAWKGRHPLTSRHAYPLPMPLPPVTRQR